MKRRESLEIVKGLLDYLVEPNSITYIMRKNNLSFEQANSYLNSLIKVGYLEKIESPVQGNSKYAYQTTEKGLRALEVIKDASEIMKEIKKHL
ncbi:MAG: winged helix-turn-helix domain-containing protein [Candidatus Aenigmatarchaeota archaeon]